MNIEKLLRIEKEMVYLRVANGAWKNFGSILEDVLDEDTVKLKKRRFRVSGQYVLGGRLMGKNCDQVWIYDKLTPEEKEKTLIYEIIGLHYENERIIESAKDNSGLLEEAAQKIWQNKNCREMIKEVLSGLVKKERRKK